MASMANMWVSGWCAALAVGAFIDGKYAIAAVDIAVALFNGFMAWINWRSKK